MKRGFWILDEAENDFEPAQLAGMPARHKKASRRDLLMTIPQLDINSCELHVVQASGLTAVHPLAAMIDRPLLFIFLPGAFREESDRMMVGLLQLLSDAQSGLLVAFVIPDSNFAAHAWLRARGLMGLFSSPQILIVSDLQRQVLRALRVSAEALVAAVALAEGLNEHTRCSFTTELDALNWLADRFRSDK